MTKPAFLLWLDQFRHVGKIRTEVEHYAWSDVDLDQLKATLVSGGRLEMKNEFKRRMAWG